MTDTKKQARHRFRSARSWKCRTGHHAAGNATFFIPLEPRSTFSKRAHVMKDMVEAGALADAIWEPAPGALPGITLEPCRWRKCACKCHPWHKYKPAEFVSRPIPQPLKPTQLPPPPAGFIPITDEKLYRDGV